MKSKQETRMSKSNIAILSKPYPERQFIVVIDDKVEKSKGKGEYKSEMELKSVGSKRAKTVLEILEDNVPATYLFTDAVKTVLKAIGKLKRKRIDVVFISRKDAQKLIFPPGHPQKKVLYVGHPTKPEIYYPFAEFHRFVFEHKFSEAMELLMALGASEFKVKYIKGWKSDFSSKFGLSITKWKPQIETSKDKNADSKLLFKGVLKSKKKPKLPKGLAWYPFEPTWQKIAKGRLKYGLKDFSLTVQYNNDYGINAKLKMKVIKAGLNIGGKFEDHKKTEWRIEGKFGKFIRSKK